MNSSLKSFVFWAVIVISAFLLAQVLRSGQSPQRAPQISYSEFLSRVEGGDVSRVTISGTHINGQYRDGHSFQVTAPSSQDGMITLLHQKNVEFWFKDATNTGWSTWLMNIAPLILLAALWFFMIRQMKQRQNRAQNNTGLPR